MAALIPPVSPTTADDDDARQQAEQRQPAPTLTTQPEPLPAIGAPLRILRLVDQWLAEDAAEELADWLAQDVH